MRASLATIDAGAGTMAAPAVPLVWPAQIPTYLWPPVKPCAKPIECKPRVALEDIGYKPGPCRSTYRGASPRLPSVAHWVVLSGIHRIDADCVHAYPCLTTQKEHRP